MLRPKFHRETDIADFLPQVDETFGQIPRQLKLAIDELARRLPQPGNRLARRAGDGNDPFGPRAFEPGKDSPLRISARHSARFDNHDVVIDRELEIKQSIYNWRDPMMAGSSEFNAGLQQGFRSRDDLLTDKVAAEISMLAWSKKLAFHNDAISVVAGDYVHRFGRNVAQIAGGLTEVSILTDSLPDPRKIRMGSHATLWGKFYDLDRAQELLERFQSRKTTGYMIRVLDPSEIDFDFPDNCEFKGLHGEASPSGQTSKIFSDASSARKQWKEQQLQLTLELEELCNENGFEVLIQRTDEPLQHSMLKMLRNENDDFTARIIKGESPEIS
jgi:hypothetical protein